MPSFTRAGYSKQSIRNEHAFAAGQMSHGKRATRMSSGRLLGAAASLILGLTLCFAALHYVPTLLRPTQVIDTLVSPSKKSLLEIDRSRLQRFGVYAQSFLLRRTYLRSGQGLTIHYSIPEGATLDLHIKQCRRMFIVEVFHCTPTSQQTVTIANNLTGQRALKFAEPGFYHFDETVTLREPNGKYRLVWIRT
jgi:hypothetical protein